MNRAGSHEHADALHALTRVQVSDESGLPAARSPEAIRALVAVQALIQALQTRAGGLGPSQIAVLELLHDKPAVSIADLTQRLRKHASTVATLVRRLAELGLVQRAPKPFERWRTHVEITQLGRTRLAEERASGGVKVLAALESMPEADQRQLADLVERWARSAGLKLGGVD